MRRTLKNLTSLKLCTIQIAHFFLFRVHTTLGPEAKNVYNTLKLNLTTELY